MEAQRGKVLEDQLPKGGGGLAQLGRGLLEQVLAYPPFDFLLSAIF